jgi:rod shape-determining protein MreD
MTILENNPREEMGLYRYSPLVYLLVPFFAVFFQSYLPRIFPRSTVLDLPLIVTIYFSLSRRSQVGGTLLGAVLGLAQDALTHLPLGINGAGKAIIGFLAASMGVRMDVENPGTRLIVVFVFSLLASVVHLFIVHALLGIQQEWRLLHELLRAVVNAPAAVLLFALLDRLRQQEQ